MATKDTQFIQVLSAAWATGAWITINVKNYKNVIFTIGTSGTANGTIKIQGDALSAPATFGSAASISNLWDYISFENVQTKTLVAWDTGQARAAADSVEMLRVNTTALSHITLNITTWVAWAFTAWVMLSDNE